MKAMLCALLLVLLSAPQAAAASDLAVRVNPAFDRAALEPTLYVTIANTGNNTLTNISVNIVTTGLDLSKNEFANTTTAYSARLEKGEELRMAVQFKYPETRDDITILIKTRFYQNSSENNLEVMFTVPAILIVNLPKPNWWWVAVGVISIVFVGVWFLRSVNKRKV